MFSKFFSSKPRNTEDSISIDIGETNRQQKPVNHQTVSRTNSEASIAAAHNALSVLRNPDNAFQPFRPEESAYPKGFTGCKIQ
jgi:hypothetical protein